MEIGGRIPEKINVGGILPSKLFMVITNSPWAYGKGWPMSSGLPKVSLGPAMPCHAMPCHALPYFALQAATPQTLQP
jgi:hypothetical protein